MRRISTRNSGMRRIFGQGVEECEELGDVEVSREWEEESRGKGWEYDYEELRQIHHEYQLDTQTDDEMGYGVPYGGSTPPWTLPLPTTHMMCPLNGPTRAPPSLLCYSWKQWWTTRI